MPGVLNAKVNGVWTPVGVPRDPLVDVARWNSAWGILAKGNFAFSPSGVPGVGGIITHQLNWKAYAGRRYLLRLQIRAASSDGTGTNIGFDLKNNGVAYGDANVLHWRFYGAWDTKIATWLFEPTSDQEYGIQLFVSHVGGIAPTLYSSGPSYYYVEDMGPVTPATVNPPIGAPVATAAGNALGVIAVGWPRSDQPVATSGSGTIPMTYATTWRSIAGRRYRINFAARAVTAGSQRFEVESNGAIHPGANDRYVAAYTQYESITCSWLVNGDNTDYTTVIRSAAGTVLSVYPTEFYIEDVGPNQYPALPVPTTPPAWTPVAGFLNGWVNYGTWPLAAYRKIGDEVSLRGLIRNGTVPATAFNMPVGFRPMGGIGGASSGHHFAVASNDAFGSVRVTADGDVRVGAGSSGWVDLATIRYSTTP